LATFFSQLYGHIRVLRTLKNKITIKNFIVGQNEISLLLFDKVKQFLNFVNMHCETISLRYHSDPKWNLKLWFLFVCSYGLRMTI